ncbi:MAG: sigma-70 family RNA polymerase sigma factor [Lentisphaerae bacterium]|nr:sigma-70 family RNA polymerase sigma factor [Lentisphaerota bacterium]MCP4101349.1 sigma-70 family RNA polymerase sigma factor [Lentisphaerota bacterium]
MDNDAICQETFINAYKKLTQLRNHNQFEQWLCRIAENCAKQYHRKNPVQLHLPFDDSINKGILVEPDIVPDNNSEIKAKLRTVLSKLTKIQKTVICEHYINGKSYREISLLLDCKENTVRSRLQKARIKLKKEMKRIDGEPFMENIIELNARDLQIINAALKAREESDRAIRGIYLDKRGKIIGTNGKVVIIRPCSALTKLSNNAVLVPPGNISIQDINKAKLLVGISEAVLQSKGHDDIVFDVIDEEFPDCEHTRIFPSSWKLKFCTKYREIYNLTEMMTSYLEEKHPCFEDFSYIPQVKFCLDSTLQSLKINIDSTMGYSGKIPEQIINWEHSACIKGKLECNNITEEILSFDLNLRSFIECLNALCNSPEEAIEIKCTDSMTPVIISSLSNPTSTSAIMPLRNK